MALLLLAGCVAAGAVWRWTAPEPHYLGTPMREWVQAELGPETFEALLEFGSQAVPLLRSRLRVRGSLWTRALAKAQPYLPNSWSARLPLPQDAATVRQQAAMNLALLGADARAAASTLRKSLRDEESP